jgi:hypothetical protein
VVVGAAVVAFADHGAQDGPGGLGLCHEQWQLSQAWPGLHLQQARIGHLLPAARVGPQARALPHGRGQPRRQPVEHRQACIQPAEC